MKKLKFNNDRPWLKFYKDGVKPNLVYSKSRGDNYGNGRKNQNPVGEVWQHLGSRTCQKNGDEPPEPS